MVQGRDKKKGPDILVGMSAQGPGVSCKFTEDEHILLIQLKEGDCRSWSEIHKRFSE